MGCCNDQCIFVSSWGAPAESQFFPAEEDENPSENAEKAEDEDIWVAGISWDDDPEGVSLKRGWARPGIVERCEVAKPKVRPKHSFILP